ncbi:hypothetical protein [Pseudodesulfovibrio sp. zrk46]|uniref:hypothetical protein n=1 Tax=Pseudodesulfovibrio sp. zrk46 TaxID=2725288 RepID=UPI0014493F42|nr:hypothetical protein [Pseudodesulfovibrio sp. zrk46]QJB56971.1 hypothetical protein HFN16_11390 [Pseudodesulfovibrio sp. zrk46]
MLMRVMMLCLATLVFAFSASAQTTDYNIVIGASPVTSPPLQVIDMSRAKDGPYGPAPGKSIQVFLLDGLFGRQGPGDSRTLDVGIRRGLPHILMFEDGRWQPLRPVGRNYGYEIDFAQRMAKALPGETVGLIVGNGNRDEVLETASVAMEAMPCDVIAYVRLADSVLPKPLVSAQKKAQLSAPDLIIYDMSRYYDFNNSNRGRPEEIHEQSSLIFQEVLKRMKTNHKE